MTRNYLRSLNVGGVTLPEFSLLAKRNITKKRKKVICFNHKEDSS